MHGYPGYGYPWLSTVILIIPGYPWTVVIHGYPMLSWLSLVIYDNVHTLYHRIIFISAPPVTAIIEIEESVDTPTVGERYSLTCRVSGIADLSQSTIIYQWRHNEDVLSETSSTLVFPALEASHAGDYSCQVTLTSIPDEDDLSITSKTYTLAIQEEYSHCVSLGK